MGKRGPNPRFSPPRPRFSGDGAGTGTHIKITGGIFGVGDGFNFGVFWGCITEIPPKIFGDSLGTGIASSLEIYEVFPPQNPRFPKIPVPMKNEHCPKHLLWDIH